MILNYDVLKFICTACSCGVHERCDNVTHGTLNSCDCQHREQPKTEE